MYKAIIIIFLSLYSIPSNAQLEVNNPYKLYLNYGRVLRGELIVEENDSLEMRLLNDSIVSVSTEDIEDFVQFKSPFPKISNYNYFDDLPNGTTYRIAGSYIIFQLGFIPDNVEDINDNPKLKPTFTLINGYRFEEGFAFGAGINLDLVHKSFFPVFIDFRKYFRPRPVTLFASGNIGNAFTFAQFAGTDDKIQEGGMMIQVGGGAIIPTKRNVNLILEVGYRNQNHKEKNDKGPGVTVFEHWILQVGLIF